MTFYYGVEQGTQEWLELRKNRATCSNAYILCANGKNRSRYANYQHAVRTSPNGNDYAKRGHVLEYEIKEKLVRQFSEEGSQFRIITDCSFITHDDFPGAGYSPDAFLVDKDTGLFLIPIEIKCFNDIVERKIVKNGKRMKYFVRTNKHKKSCEGLKNVPFDLRMQFQMEMLMTDTEELLLVLYNPDAEEGVPVIKFHVVKREERYINRLRERILEKQ